MDHHLDQNQRSPRREIASGVYQLRTALSLNIAITIAILMAVLSKYRFAIMGAVTIRNLPDEVRRAIKVRAARNNRSAEAEMRAILEAAARPEERVRIGSQLSQMSRKAGLSNADIEALAPAQDAPPAEPLDLQ